MALSHVTGESLCVLYGNHDQQAGANADLPGAVGQGPRAAASAPGAVGQGPVVTFNLLRPDGTFFGYRSAASKASFDHTNVQTVCLVVCCSPLPDVTLLLLFVMTDLQGGGETSRPAWDTLEDRLLLQSRGLCSPSGAHFVPAETQL